MCPPGYYDNGFMGTHALGHMMYGYTLLVPMSQRVLNKLTKEHNISGLLEPAIYNRTSCAQVHDLPQRHFGDNREDTLFS